MGPLKQTESDETPLRLPRREFIMEGARAPTRARAPAALPAPALPADRDAVDGHLRRRQSGARIPSHLARCRARPRPVDYGGSRQALSTFQPRGGGIFSVLSANHSDSFQPEPFRLTFLSGECSSRQGSSLSGARQRLELSIAGRPHRKC